MPRRDTRGTLAGVAITTMLVASAAASEPETDDHRQSVGAMAYPWFRVAKPTPPHARASAPGNSHKAEQSVGHVGPLDAPEPQRSRFAQAISFLAAP